ncbi:Glycosyl transferase family 2 [Clostridium amylolyticum]|uniref:Glycosyl transferase family 2 n=2 Tax=Clostridium amylolyticum TaxID=1121298 RepID=A0A1M6M6P7_9CLOT|nr:Glycosyl transferase family 2 [Clostridium amylolyticum]
MDVSVIVPFYNNVNWLYDAINSINESPHLSYEVIIVNDGSNEIIDKSRFVNSNNAIRIIEQPNQGPGKARNNGIDLAVGEYIAFLDSDDLFVKNKLSKQIQYMKDNNLQWCHSSYIKFYENKNEELVDNSCYSGMIFPKCLAYNPIATPTVMVKRVALENPTKRFSETMRFGQDGFMWSQLAANYSVGVISEPLSLVRMRGTNATLKARNHLYVKSNMYNYLKQSDKYYNGKKIPAIIKAIFAIADFNYKIIDLIYRNWENDTSVEILARLLYSTQYLALKFYKIKK